MRTAQACAVPRDINLVESGRPTTLDKIAFCWTRAMAKSTAVQSAGAAEPQSRKSRSGGRALKRDASAGQVTTVHATQVEAVMAAAQRSGLLLEKSGRIGGRVSQVLVEKAKARTGITTGTDLIEFALANIALEDKFAESFKAARGTVDPDLDLSF